MMQSYLEEDVNDAAVAQEAENGEEKEKQCRKVTDQGMLHTQQNIS